MYDIATDTWLNFFHKGDILPDGRRFSANAILDFDDIFLTAGALVIDESTSAPYYMAANGIDVWGIDLAWNRVPIAPPEGFEFMKDWGVDKDIDHVMKSLAIARSINDMRFALLEFMCIGRDSAIEIFLLLSFSLYIWESMIAEKEWNKAINLPALLQL